MTAEFSTIPECDFDKNGNPINLRCNFVVFVNGKVFCSTKNKSHAISIVKWFNLYAENKKQEEINALIERLIADEKLFLEFITNIRRAYLDKQEMEERERQAFTPEY